MIDTTNFDVVARLRERAAMHREEGWELGNDPTLLERAADLIDRLSSSRGEQGWRTIDSAPKDGTSILVYFRTLGVRQVTWEESISGNEIWCVDDNKHGPYALRGYSEGDDTHWMPLPSAPGSVPTSLAGQVPDEVLSTIGDWAKWARDWSGSAFIAGEPVEDEAEARGDLYAGLCRLGNEMLWLGDEVLKLSASPVLALSDECVNSLTNKRQIDDTGEMVGVSHQAVDEIYAALVACRSAAPQPTAGGDADAK